MNDADYQIAFDWDEEYVNYNTGNSRQVFLSEFDIHLILSCLRFAHWPNRWDIASHEYHYEKFQNIISLVECLEVKLRNCTSTDDLVKTNLLLIAAIAGQQIDLDAVDANYFTGVHDFREKGLANRLGPEVFHNSPNTIQATLKALKAADPSTLGELLGKVTTAFPEGSRIRTLVESVQAYVADADITIEEAEFLVELLDNAINNGLESTRMALDLYSSGLNTADVIEDVVATGTEITKAVVDSGLEAAQTGVGLVGAATNLGNLWVSFLNWIGWSSTGLYQKRHLEQLEQMNQNIQDNTEATQTMLNAIENVLGGTHEP